MVAILVSAPQEEPVTRDDAKAHARIDGTSEDGTIDALIAAARTDVESRTGRALMLQGWRIVRDCIPAGGIVRLAPSPVVSVDAVTIYGNDGAPNTVSTDEYQVDTISTPARMRFNTGAAWSARAMNGLEVDITCGYASASMVPAPLKQAVLMLVAYWFEQREAASLRAVAGPVAHGVDALIAPYRMPRLS